MIKLLMQNELYIAKLYEIYAQLFPVKRDFWLKMSEDEKSHARALQSLGEKISHGKVFFN